MASTSCQRFTSIKVGELAEFMFYKKDRSVDWKAPDLEKQFPPDAIFSTGKWLKGERVVPAASLDTLTPANTCGFSGCLLLLIVR